MVDDFFWEVIFILDTVLLSIPKTVVDYLCVCLISPGVFSRSHLLHPKFYHFKADT